MRGNRVLIQIISLIMDFAHRYSCLYTESIQQGLLLFVKTYDIGPWGEGGMGVIFDFFWVLKAFVVFLLFSSIF